MPGALEPLQVIAGVEPSTDKPEATTMHYTDTKAIRFVDGLPEKIGGWRSISLDNNVSIGGKARSIFPYELGAYNRQLIGTSSRLYYLLGSSLTNITPLKTDTISHDS